MLLCAFVGRPSTAVEGHTLETVVVVFVILWLLGVVSSYTMGGLVHVLLVVAIVMVLLRIIQGRRIV